MKGNFKMLDTRQYYYTTYRINPNWSDYERGIANCHLATYGKIYVDREYNTPIDNEYELEEIILSQNKRLKGII